MLEKIDKFTDRFLKWKVLKYFLLGDLLLIPWTLISSTYHLSFWPRTIMMASVISSVSCFTKAIFNLKERE